jgi:hypothetical protein
MIEKEKLESNSEPKILNIQVIEEENKEESEYEKCLEEYEECLELQRQ